MTQPRTHQARVKMGSSRSKRWGGLLPLVLLFLVAVPASAVARDLYYGADSRYAGGLGGYEGSVVSHHPHGWGGYHGFPNRWTAGHGPASDTGHAGEVLRYGRGATPPGHHFAGYQIQRPYLRGAYDRRCGRLFSW
jgi:hypothetical protein